MDKISTSAPLVITLKIEESNQQFFNEQRKKYFPAHCNYVEAHVTLFHKLPSNNSEIEKVLEKFSTRKIFNISGCDIVLQKTAVAYEIASEDLLLLHKEMQDDLQPYLIRNDRKKLWPHITIQNKVTAYKAFKTHAALLSTFKPRYATAIGFSCWYYVKGYWEKKGDFLFCN